MSKKILLVDDEEKIRIVMRERLESEGYEVDLAVDGKDALHMVKKFHPDLIVLDVMMPKLDGFQVLEHLKKDKSTMDIPVIMLTCLSQPEDIKRGIEEEAECYITKPFSSQHFIEEIEKCFRGRGISGTTEQKENS